MGLVVSVVLSVGVLVGLLVFAFVGGRSPVKTEPKDAGPVPPTVTTIPAPDATTMPATAPPLPMPPLQMPHSLVPENVEFAPRAVRVIDAAALVGVLPDAIEVTIESEEPDLRGFSGTYYYSFSVGFGWDPRIRSWAWTLDSVAAPGGNGYRGKTRAQLSYGNKEGTWDLSLNTGDPYPAPPVLLRATTGPGLQC